MADSVFEFRGVQDLYYAQVLEDSEEKFTTTIPKRLSYVATIAKEVETSSETHFYDNKGMIARSYRIPAVSVLEWMRYCCPGLQR